MNDLILIKKPLITERSTILKEKFNQYVFQVDPRCNKAQIKEVIQRLFKVQVDKVRTANFQGKLRRLSAGRPQGRRASWKKAIVTVRKGQEIKMEQETA